jgi:RNA polymerase sigma-70 factor (ECF subfamily)
VALAADDSAEEGAAGPAAATPTPSRELMTDEQTRVLYQAIARLPEDYRRILLLRYQEERSFEEIAVLMQRTANAARKLWGRAVERLQQELDLSP